MWRSVVQNLNASTVRLLTETLLTLPLLNMCGNHTNMIWAYLSMLVQRTHTLRSLLADNPSVTTFRAQHDMINVCVRLFYQQAARSLSPCYTSFASRVVLQPLDQPAREGLAPSQHPSVSLKDWA